MNSSQSLSYRVWDRNKFKTQIYYHITFQAADNSAINTFICVGLFYIFTSFIAVNIQMWGFRNKNQRTNCKPKQHLTLYKAIRVYFPGPSPPGMTLPRHSWVRLNHLHTGVGCSAQQCTNGAWCPRQTAAAEQRSKRPITY